MDWTAIATFAAAVLTILNPIGNTALFGTMVSGRSQAEQRAIAVKCAAAVGVILIGTIWIGEQVLGVFGVSIAALEAAGGLIIALIAMSMLHSKQSAMHSDKPSDDGGASDAIAIVPLAMPIVAGPGAIATVIVSTHAHQGLESNLVMSAVCLVGAVAIGACFLLSGLMMRVLGQSGMSIVTKFMGIILLAIAVGMLASGAKGLLPGLGSSGAAAPPAESTTAS